jgi:hypothetical protein
MQKPSRQEIKVGDRIQDYRGITNSNEKFVEVQRITII